MSGKDDAKLVDADFDSRLAAERSEVANTLVVGEHAHDEVIVCEVIEVSALEAGRVVLVVEEDADDGNDGSDDGTDEDEYSTDDDA